MVRQLVMDLTDDLYLLCPVFRQMLFLAGFDLAQNKKKLQHLDFLPGQPHFFGRHI